MFKLLNKAFNEHKMARRLLLLWAVWLITVVTFRVFPTDNRVVPDIPSGTATVFSIVVGLLATAIGFYQWSRSREDKLNNKGVKENDNGDSVG